MATKEREEGAVKTVRKLYQESLRTVSHALDLDAEGRSREALPFYINGMDQMRTAFSIDLTPSEIDEVETILNKLQRSYLKVEERIEELTPDEKPVKSTWTPWFSNVHNPKVAKNYVPYEPVGRTSDGKKVTQNPNIVVQKRGGMGFEEISKGVSQPQTPQNNASPAVPVKSRQVGRSLSKTKSAPEKKGIPSALKGIDKKIQEAIINEIVDDSPGVAWDDVSGLVQAKDSLMEMVILPFLRPDIFNGLRSPPRGVLLFGPPGTGKTMLAKAVATESKSTFFNVKASTLVSKYMGESEKLVRTLFAIAEYMTPSIVFIDEIDSLLTERNETEHEASRRMKNEFLVQLDGLSSPADAQSRILVMGATNRPQDLDEAARRRLHRRIYVPLPNKEARKSIIEKMLKKQKSQITKSQLETIAEKSEGYSAADVVDLVKEAAMGPVRGLGRNIASIRAEDVRPVMYKDFEASFQNVRSSVSDQSLKGVEEWNKLYGSYQLKK